jgi:taurine dioxygenase
MPAIKVRNLRDDLAFGSIVEGVNREALADNDVRGELNALFERRGFIVFKEVEPTAKMQVELSKVFGPLKDHPTKATPRDAASEDLAEGVIDMHYVPSDDPNYVGGLVEVDGRRLARFSPWHFDHCYNNELNRAGVLRAPINAPEGGRTGFVDGIELYKKFPKEMLAKLEKMNIIYTLDVRLTKMRFGVNFVPLGDAPQTKALLKEVAIFPRAMHPAVWTRRTGEKVLHVGPWMSVGIEHHETPEGDAFLDEVAHTVNRLAAGSSGYWHDWTTTDMVIWDNWRMLHAVEGCDAKYERRTLRTTIKGDYGLGYFEDGKKIGEVFRVIAD